MTTTCVPVIAVLCVLVALATVFILVFIVLMKDKTCDLLKKTERDEDDCLDIQSRDAGRAANAARGVYVIPDVPQSGESHLLDTTQVQVKGQWPVVGEELPVPSRDETNKKTSEDTQYDTLVQQRPDEREAYMSLHVMSAATRPQVEGQVTHHFVLP